jgi:hypothetical protein
VGSPEQTGIRSELLKEKAVTSIPTLTRRQLLKIGAVSLSGFELLPMARPLNAAAKARVKPRGSAEYCIFVFLQGGASHLDTFDVKEGRWTPPDFGIQKVTPEISLPMGLFPKLATRLPRIALVRSMETWETEHGRATYYLHVAHPISPARLAEIPALGAVVAYEFRDKRKQTDFLPPFISMNYGPDRPKEGCLSPGYGPLNLDTRGGSPAFLVPESERGRFARRIGYLDAMAALPSPTQLSEPPRAQIDTFRGDALGMMQSPKLPEILRLDEEDKKRYGSSPFGDSCILARNLLAARNGTRFVALQHGGWDFHTNIYDKSQKSNHYTVCRTLDQGLAELITDLGKMPFDGGSTLLDKTLVVCLGEFGRTPGDITVGKGRDHHRFAMTGLFAGAGVAGGRALGATDEQGARVVRPGWPRKRSMYPEDVAATIYSALGIDWTKEITNTPSGRVFQYLDFQSGTDFLDVSEIEPLFG